MLDMLHKIEVNTGDAFIIQGGVPHAIGEGCFLLEVQEPTDFTMRTERVTPQGLQIHDAQCHCGVGFDKMFDCFEYDGYTLEEVCNKWKVVPTVMDTDAYTELSLIDKRYTDLFSMINYSVKQDTKFDRLNTISIFVIMDGSATFNDGHNQIIVSKGDFVAIAANVANLYVQDVKGKLEMVELKPNW